jgi:hypothetical protein
MANYIQGNLLNIFYHDGDGWKFFAYTQSSGLQIQNSLNDISSKDHGLHPDKLASGQTWSISNEAYATVSNLKVATNMAIAGKEYSFCFAKVNEGGDAWSTGLKDVTSVGDVSTWTPGTDFVKYGNGIVDSAQINSQTGDMGSISLNITGLGALSDTAPATPKSYTTA